MQGTHENCENNIRNIWQIIWYEIEKYMQRTHVNFENNLRNMC